MNVKSHFFVLVCSIFFLQQGCAVKTGSVKNHSLLIDSSFIKIKVQQKKSFDFSESRISFSNNFLSARLNGVSQQNDSTFSLTITAESRPINSSPWYAFKVWSARSRNLYLKLTYPDDKHRYAPKVSKDGLSWQNIETIVTNKEKTEATFKLFISSDTMLVAAQELINSIDNERWVDSIAKKTELKKEIIGYSINHKPIISLNTKSSNGKKIVVVISRQHPPEITGYLAMKKFVSVLLGNTELAKRFRKEYELVVIPMVNPDGVDEGNWRHSFAGVDLNRDWIDFKQPETRAVRDYLLEKVNRQGAKVYFAIDFHSTYDDVLYTNEEKKSSHMPGLVNNWIAGLHQFEGENQTPVKPSGNGGNVSKAWFGKTLNAEALTYEVGDQTPRAYINKKVTKVAEVLMENLLKE